MRLTKTQLKRIIREERSRLLEVGPPPDMDTPGWHPNDSQEWEREAEFEEKAELEQEKLAFLSNVSVEWYEDFADPEVSENPERSMQLIDDALSDCYDRLMSEIIGDY